MTTQSEIRSWLNEAKKEGATHMLVVCDTYDHDDYPVPVKPGQNVRDVFNKYSNESMQKAVELLARGDYPSRGLVSHLFPLPDYRRAFRAAFDKRRHHSLKVALDLRV